MKPGSFSRRHRRILWLGTLLVVGVALRALLPLALEAGAESLGGRALGRVVELDNVDLALHRGGVRAEGLRIGGPLPTQGEPSPVSPAEALLSVSSVTAEWSWWSLVRGAVHFRFLEVVSPELQLEHSEDGSLTPFVLAEAKPNNERAEAEAAWPVALDLFSLRDAVLTLSDGRENEVEFQLAEFSLAELAFQEGQLSLGAVGLSEPRVRVRRELAIGERPITPAPRASAPTASGQRSTAPGHRIRSIEIERAEFTLLTDDEPLQVALAFSAQEVTIDPGETFPLALHLELADGTLDVNGRFGAVPPRFDGHVEWAKVGFPVLSRALGLELPIRIESVQSSGSLDVVAALGDGEVAGTLRLSGALKAKDAVGVVTATQERLAVDSLALELSQFEMALGADPARAAAARFSGAASSRGILFETPESELIVRLAKIDAAELTAEIPLAPGAGALRAAGKLRGEGIELETKPGDRVVVNAIELALAELVVPPAGEPAQDLGIRASVRAEGLEVASPIQGVSAAVAGAVFRDVVVALPAALEARAPRIEVAAIRVDRPLLKITRAASTTADEPAPSAAGDRAAPDPRARIAHVEVRGGVVEFIDQGVEPFARSRVVEIGLTASELRWPERTVGSFALQSHGPAQATFAASGNLGAAGTIDWALASLPLPHFNPYAKPVGYRIKAGEGAIRGALSVRGERVEVDSQLVLDQLDLSAHRSEEFEGQIGVPLGLAVALLKDPAGRISLPIRFEASRDEVRAQIVPLALATLRHAVVGAVTLPFKALKGLAAGGGDDFSFPIIVAAPGLAAPNPSAAKEVAALAKLLSERPGLALVVRGQAGPEDERPLAAVLLVERVSAGMGLPESVEVGFFARRRLRNALKEHGASAREAVGDEDQVLLEAMVAAVEVPAQRVQALADARAAALRDVLLRDYGVSPQRVRVTAAGVGAPGSAAELVAASALPTSDVVSTGASPGPVSSGP